MKKFLLWLSIFALIGSTAGVTASAAVKAGGKCSKVNSTSTVGGYKYTCIKSGKKLVWSKGVKVVAKAKPTPSATPAPTPSPTPSATPTATSTPTPTPVPSATATATSTPTPTPVPSATATATPTPAPSTTPEPIPTPTPSATPTPSPAPSVMESPSPSPSAWKDPREGMPCTTENEIVPNQIWELKCVKQSVVTPGSSGNNLVWSQNNPPPGWTPTPTPTPTPALPNINYTPDNNVYAEPKMVGSPLEKCMIKENSVEGNAKGNLASGFPFMSRFATYPKEIKMAYIPIDFSDLAGEADYKTTLGDQPKTVSDWYNSVSSGKLSVTWTIGNEWIRLPGLSADYVVPFSGSYPETANFWKKVLPIIDAKYDLTGIQVINFILPNGQTIIKESVQSFPFLDEMKNVNSTKTKLISFATAGVYFDGKIRPQWSYWAHEFGHVIGLAHIGSSRGSSQTINGYDLMGNQDGPYRELSGWMRFIIGWLDDSQVYCQNVESLVSNEVSLIPLSDSKSGVKIAVIPTAIDSAIVIESRRPTKFSCDIPNLPSGVFVYTYDAKLGNQEYFLTAQYPLERPKNIRCADNFNMELYPDALLHNGDSIQVGNYVISVISSGNVDQVRITKK